MRQPDPAPVDPQVASTLEAIDATLAGQTVDPRQAELAELALLLADERPSVPAEFATRLDQRVERRFAAPARAGRRRRVSWWAWTPVTGVAVALIVAVVIVLGQGGGPGPSFGSKGSAASAASSVAEPHEKLAATPHHHAAAPRASSAGPVIPAPAGNQYLLAPPTAGMRQSLSGPPTVGRKVIQGAQLSLATTSRRVDQVAQEVYNVVGQQNGIVKSSRVTATGGQGGYAQFQLSVPSANLTPAMTALSNLSYARVVSRTDTSQDVTNQYNVDQQRLTDAQALRSSLLKQLAGAVTQAQIDSLTARIHDAEAAIAADQATLHSLQRQVGYSQIFVTLSSDGLPAPAHRNNGGLTLGRATHDAGKVLTAAAGVALIGLAALLPIGLVLALLWWIYAAARRRRRLQALDLP